MNLATLRTLWASLLGAHFILAYLLQFIINQDATRPEITKPVFFQVVSLLSVAAFIAAIYIPRFLLDLQKKQFHRAYSPVALKQLNFEDFIKSYSSPLIIRLALFELIAVLGFGLGFLHKNFTVFIPFVAISAMAFFVNFPSEEKIKDVFDLE